MAGLSPADDALATRYLDALGLDAQAPTLPFLSEITRHHVACFAFSSIGPRLADDLPLEPAALFDRIVSRRRGGYCFEQNGLLFEVLVELGYVVRLQMARVILNQAEHPGLTHRVTVAAVEGRDFVVDVGFGPMGPPSPVALPADGATDPVGGYRVLQTGPLEYRMQRQVEGDWLSLYRFDAVRYGQSDAELGHFYSHRHPDASFVNNLVASRILTHEVRSLRNRDYWVITPRGTSTERIASADRLHALLTAELGLDVSEGESARLWADLPEG